MVHRPVNFIIIGAMRCGTTSLYYDLARHPEISMSRKKETDYFLGDCPPDVYQKQFNPSKILWGEASPNYSKLDIFENVPEKIYKHSPNVKLIYLVRDPADRVVSQYRHGLAMGRFRQDDQLSMDGPELKHMIATSKYFAQLEKFREFFSKKSILIVSVEEFSKSRKVTLDKIAHFIGANRFEWGAETARDNSSLAIMKYPKIMTKMRDSLVLQKLYTSLPHGLQTRAKTLVSHQSFCIDNGEDFVICRDELLSELRADILAFGKEYEFDVSSWLKGSINV